MSDFEKAMASARNAMEREINSIHESFLRSPASCYTESRLVAQHFKGLKYRVLQVKIHGEGCAVRIDLQHRLYYIIKLPLKDGERDILGTPHGVLNPKELHFD
jgi:hypothetical protein